MIYGHAVTLDGKNAVQTQSYGSASRGGACKCDVIVSDDQIYELEFPQPDILIALSQQAYDKYSPQLKEEGILIIEEDLVCVKKDHKRIYSISATDIAYKKFGRKIVANMVILGYMTAILGNVTKKAVQKAIRQHIPQETEIMNIKAFEEGYRLGFKASGDVP